MKRKSFKAKIIDKFNNAVKECVKAYDLGNRLAIEQTFNWGKYGGGFGVTLRKNGEVVVGDNRNIRDLGNLANSQTIIPLPHGAIFQWDGNGVTPAAIVHEGATFSNGSSIPPRPWTTEALWRADLLGTFIETFNNS